MTEKVKFVSISRTINDSSGIHFLDAISENGEHYSAEMSPNIEKWLVWTKQWHKDNSQPLDL
jgi:hypothetical protein